MQPRDGRTSWSSTPGSSSLKYSLVDGETGEAPADGHGRADRRGERPARARRRGRGARRRSGRSPTTRRRCRPRSTPSSSTARRSADAGVVAVGHRVVHGGEQFSAPTLIDDDVVAAVEALVPLAPLHNPANLEGIAVARKLFPDLPQVAVFDTAFHQTMPPVAYTYAVPRAWLVDHHVRRYGFHGTSHAYVARAAAAALGRAGRGRQRDRAAPRQRRVGGRRTRRSLGRHLHGPDAAGGAGDGHPLRRPRPGRAHAPAPLARLVARGDRPRPQPRVGPQGTGRGATTSAR